MDEVPHEKQERRGITGGGLFLPFLPKLLFTLGVMFLRFKRRAKKAGKVFQKELMRQGIDKHTASELTAMYLKGSELRSFIKSFR